MELKTHLAPLNQIVQLDNVCSFACIIQKGMFYDECFMEQPRLIAVTVQRVAWLSIYLNDHLSKQPVTSVTVIEIGQA